MVTTSIQNDPVNIVLGGGESTTVPTNEVWKVSIHMGTRNKTNMEIDGIGKFTAERTQESAHGSYLDVVLVGGNTIAETNNDVESVIIISGFVVDS